jgi:hypothetical protein
VEKSIHLSIRFVDSFDTLSLFSAFVLWASHRVDFPAFLELAKMGQNLSIIDMEKRVWSGVSAWCCQRFEMEWNEIDGIGRHWRRG